MGYCVLSELYCRAMNSTSQLACVNLSGCCPLCCNLRPGSYCIDSMLMYQIFDCLTDVEHGERDISEKQRKKILLEFFFILRNPIGMEFRN